MFSKINWMYRILTDVFIVTSLFSIALGTFLGFINRRGEEKNRSWLYLSFLFLFLGLFVFFDNTLAGYLNQSPDEMLWRIPIINLSQYGVFIFSMLSLAAELGLNKKQRRPLIITGLFLSNATLSSFLIIKNGWAWYGRNLTLPVFLFFGLAIVFSAIYCGILLFVLKKHRDFRSLISYIGIAGTGLFIYILKVYQEMNPELYQTQTYLFLVLFLLIFLFLLSRESHLEYRELKELRKTRMILDQQTPINSDVFRAMTNNISQDKLPFKASERECRIIMGLCNGLLYKEIALDLDISLSSVKKGIHGIYKKAEVQNCVELIKLLISLI